LLYDPLHREVELPLRGEFFPLGFRAEIATNSPEVLEAARESFGAFAAEFESRTLRLRIVVQTEGGVAPEPVFRSQEHYFSILADAQNFAFYDSKEMSGFAFVSEQTAANREWFRFHFLDTMCYMLLAQESIMPLHAACVARGNRGLLLYGHAGAGKSTLSWACARAGWTYITDDGACLLPGGRDRVVLGRGQKVRLREGARQLFPELSDCEARMTPGGKTAIELDPAARPGIQRASRARAEAVVVLERRESGAAAAELVPADEVADMLLGDMPWYGDQVYARYRCAVDRLLEAPAYRLVYADVQDAVRVLDTLVSG
jgi:hypothetical protein